MLAAHPGSHTLLNDRLAAAGGPHNSHMGVFVFPLVEQVQDHQGVVMLVGPHEGAAVVADLEGGEHIGAGGGVGEDVPPAQPVQLGGELCQRQGGEKRLLLEIGAVFQGDLLGCHHLHHLAHPVLQVLPGEGFDGDQDIEVVELLPVIQPPLEIVAGFHNVPHLVEVGAGAGDLP